MQKNKFYVVWKGRIPGIYKSWEECSLQIGGFNGAAYKSFKTLTEAEQAFRTGPDKHPDNKKAMALSLTYKNSKVVPESICVDGACNTVSGNMEYRGVYTKTGEELFRKGPFYDGTNNIGEFLAIVHALALMKKQKKILPVYSDSHTAITWVRNKRAKTKLQVTGRNAILFEMIARAEKWLLENKYQNAVIKWDTPRWGEIPADFGRK